MPMTILDCTITSDRTPHTARLASGGRHAWEVSWLPGRRLTRNQAITAMALAEMCDPSAARGGDYWERMRPHIQGWAAELDLTPLKALIKMADPPSWAGPTCAALGDPEAGG